MAQTASFDITSTIDLQEVDNAVNDVVKAVSTEASDEFVEVESSAA